MSALQQLEKYKGELCERFEVAPTWMQFPAEYGFAIQQLRANSFLAGVADNNPASMLEALSNVAACGLSLNPAKKEAYLVPRKGKICLDPSYMGIIKLATDTGAIVWAQAKLVYEKDRFVLRGVDESPIHEQDPFSKDRGAVVGAYCVVKTKDGDYLTEAMSIDDIHAIRDRSEAFKSGLKTGKESPWTTDPGEMYRKTVVKRASKYWPKSDNIEAQARLAAAIQISHDADDIQLSVSAPMLSGHSDEDKAYYDQLIQREDALEMYVFQQTKPMAVFNSLYHSFPQGQKGKYQKIVDGLTNKGHSDFADYLLQYQEYKAQDDDLGLTQIREEVSDSVWELLEQRG